jgi:hypothetical protein
MLYACCFYQREMTAKIRINFNCFWHVSLISFLLNGRVGKIGRFCCRNFLQLTFNGIGISQSSRCLGIRPDVLGTRAFDFSMLIRKVDSLIPGKRAGFSKESDVNY